MRLVSVLRRTGPSTRSGIEAGALTAALAVFCAGTFCFGAPVNALGQTPGQTPANPASHPQPGAKPPTAATHSTHSAKHAAHPKAAKPAPTPPVVAVVPPPVPLPDWPVNDKAQPASVSWNGRDLTIAATNSSLQQILTEISTATGVKVEGEQSDQRIFGSYGPAPARDVLSQLLDGSGYNVLIIGDKGEGTPRELVLTARTHTAPSNPAGNVQSRQNSDDDAQEEPEPQPEQQNPIQRRFPMQPGQNRSPEQIQQEQQQRLQQQLQQNPQQQNPQQPNPQQPPND